MTKFNTPTVLEPRPVARKMLDTLALLNGEVAGHAKTDVGRRVRGVDGKTVIHGSLTAAEWKQISEAANRLHRGALAQGRASAARKKE